MPVAAGKAGEVFARVKQLLLVQEQTIKKQQKQLKEQKAHASKEVQSLRAEVQAMKKQLVELSARTQAEDQAISDLASFLDQHGGGAPSDSGKAESEAA
jgi:predicted  nucleic acid-binding Zn-ribbon protein